jgi:hypothetical protein
VEDVVTCYSLNQFADLVPELKGTDARIVSYYVPYMSQYIIELHYDGNEMVSVEINDEDLHSHDNPISDAFAKLASRYRLMKGIKVYG